MDGLANPWWAFVLLGLCAGILSGALGVGSGIIVVPALVMVFCLPQKSAQGTALAVMVPMALAGAILYRLNPEVRMNWLFIALIAAGAVAGAFGGALLSRHIPAGVLRKVFAIFIIIVGARMLWPGTKAVQAPPADGAEQSVTETET
ncbi:MAG: sulfite exporter TauE/SafE family protein [Planctomycetia bacterium]|nr:sulfite exporter TauE/SafE family protein [Planctomycetia bacterium]